MNYNTTLPPLFNNTTTISNNEEKKQDVFLPRIQQSTNLPPIKIEPDINTATTSNTNNYLLSNTTKKRTTSFDESFIDYLPNTSTSNTRNFKIHSPKVEKLILPSIDTITIRPILDTTTTTINNNTSLIPIHSVLTDITPPDSSPCAKKQKRALLLKKYAKRLSNNNNSLNICYYCNSTSTPEWRRGPDGNRTLCNACGLYYRKLIKKFGYQNSNLLLRYRKYINSTDRRVPDFMVVPNSFAKILDNDDSLNDDYSSK